MLDVLAPLLPHALHACWVCWRCTACARAAAQHPRPTPPSPGLLWALRQDFPEAGPASIYLNCSVAKLSDGGLLVSSAQRRSAAGAQQHGSAAAQQRSSAAAQQRSSRRRGAAPARILSTQGSACSRCLQPAWGYVAVSVLGGACAAGNTSSGVGQLLRCPTSAPSHFTHHTRYTQCNAQVYSPVAPTPEMLDQLSSLSAPVTHIVAPSLSPEHWLYVKSFADCHPDATVWVCPGACVCVVFVCGDAFSSLQRPEHWLYVKSFAECHPGATVCV